MCFTPQRRALFQHLNFSKVLRTWCALRILTSKYASRHNGVQFFISHLARWLLTRRFSEPTFRPSGATNQCFATLLPFRAPASSVFCLFLFSDLLSSSLLFSSLTLPTSSFSSVHIVESLISKLASVNIQGGQAYHIQPGPTKKGM